MVKNEEGDMIGTTISHYKILEKLGEARLLPMVNKLLDKINE